MVGKKFSGGKARAPNPQEGRASETVVETNLLVAAHLGACLFWMPARRRRHEVQPKAGGSARKNPVGGRRSPT
jgi:hypothetical protein